MAPVNAFGTLIFVKTSLLGGVGFFGLVIKVSFGMGLGCFERQAFIEGSLGYLCGAKAVVATAFARETFPLFYNGRLIFAQVSR